MAKVKGSPKRINNHNNHTNWGILGVVWPRKGWVLPGVLNQDKLHMKEYLPCFQLRYIERKWWGAQLYNDPKTTPGHGTHNDAEGLLELK